MVYKLCIMKHRSHSCEARTSFEFIRCGSNSMVYDAPYAQRLDLGWVIIGEVCIEAAHKPSGIQNYRTNALENQRIFANSIQVKKQYVLKPAHQVAPAPGTCSIQEGNLGSAIFNTSGDNKKIGLAIEDRLFLRGFRIPCQQLPHN